MKTALQLYTVRDYMEKDFYGTIKKVADIGFKAVEFAGYFDQDFKEIRKFLDDNGLECCSSHLGVADENNVEKVCDELKTLGAKNWVINIDGTGSDENFINAYNALVKSAKLCAERDINVLFHNHWWEHETKLNGKPFFEYVLENAENVYSQLDLAWTLVGGFDPEERVKNYNDKIKLLHCKDCTADIFGGAWIGGTTLRTQVINQVANGDGNAKIKECVAASNSEYAIVELDVFSGCMWDAVEKSYKYLKEVCNCE